MDEVPVVALVTDGVDERAGDADGQALTNVYGATPTFTGTVPVYRFDVSLRVIATEQLVCGCDFLAP